MRVLLICHLYPPDGVTGVERYTKSLATELVALGDTVSIITRRPGNEGLSLLREQAPEGATIYRLCGGQVPAHRFLAHHQALEHHFTSVLLEARPDVVHCNHLLFHAPRCLEIARRLGVAVVLTLHDYYFACPLLNLRKPSGEACRGPEGGMECARTCFASEATKATVRWSVRLAYFRCLLRLAAQVICPSRYVAGFFDRFGVAADRLHVIPNGLWVQKEAMPAVPACGQQMKELRLAYLGAVVSHKGLHVLLEALALARLAAVHLLVAGPTPNAAYAGKLRGLASSVPGLIVQWQGPYEPADLPQALAGVDCLVVPSQCPETFSFVVREAFAYGVPVVVARLGALPEVVQDGENGLTFAHDRPEELAGLLRRLCLEDTLLGRLKAGAQRTPFLTIAAHAAAVRQVYEEAIRETRCARPLAHGDATEIVSLERALVTLGFG
jgi:glycosyltransferase involved in cell wall biosynthesis